MALAWRCSVAMETGGVGSGAEEERGRRNHSFMRCSPNDELALNFLNGGGRRMGSRGVLEGDELGGGKVCAEGGGRRDIPIDWRGRRLR